MSPCPTINFHFSANNNNTLDRRRCEGKAAIQNLFILLWKPKKRTS